MKRLLSLFLALSMAISFLPAMSIASAQEPEGLKITYDLAAHMTAKGMTYNAGGEGTAPDITTIDYDCTTGFYKVYSSTHANHTSNSMLYRGKFLQNRCNGRRISFEIYVPREGDYDLSAMIYKATNGGNVEVYVDPAEGYTSFENLVNTYDCSGGDANFGSNTPGNEEVIAEDIPLEQGNYIITFRAIDDNDSSKNQLYGAVGTFSLSCPELSGSFLMGATITGFDGGKVNVRVGMSNGDIRNLADVSDASVEYASGSEDIVKVDKDGNITEVAPGTAVISAKVTVGDDSFTATKEYSIYGLSVKYDLATHMTAKGMTYSAGRDGKAPDLATLDYICTDGFYKVYSSSKANHTSNSMLYRGKFLQNRCDGKRISFEIYVPKTGEYDLATTIYRAKDGSKVEVYIDPAEGYSSYSNLVNTYDCNGGDAKFGSNTPGNEEVIAENIPLTKGKYIITFRAKDSADSSSNKLYGSVSSFTLSSDMISEPLPMAACIKSEKETVLEGGGITKVSAVVSLSDGTFAAVENAEITALTPEYATFDETFGVIIGKAAGKAEFSVQATYRGEPIEGKFAIQVEENNFVVGRGEKVFYDIASRVAAEPEINGPKSFGGLGYAALTYASNGELWEYAANRTNGLYSWEEKGWGYATYSDYNYTRFRTNASSGGLQMRVTKDNWFAIKVRVPYTGLYFPSATYWMYGGRGEGAESYMDYFLIKNDGTAISELLTNADLTVSSENYVGSKLTVDSSLASSQSYRYNEPFDAAVSLDKGEYYLVYKTRNVTGGNNNAMASDFTLDGVNCVKDIYISADRNINWNETTAISVLPVRLDGTVVPVGEYTVTYSSSDTTVATVDADGVVKGVGDGPVNINVTVSDAYGSRSKSFDFHVTDNTGVKDLIFNVTERIYVNQKILLDIDAVMNSENVLDIPDECISYKTSSDSIVSINNGILMGVETGNATVTTEIDFRGDKRTLETSVTVIPGTGKTGPDIYTYEMRENALDNGAKYTWARDMRKKAENDAEYLVANAEAYRSLIFGEGIPRGRQIGAPGDEVYEYCRYCHANIDNEYTMKTDYINRPWKVQCEVCKRIFPSNDFASFYTLGVDETGLFFDVDRARKAHHKMLFHTDGSECTCTAPTEKNTPEWYIFYGYGNPEGYLYNELYDEIRDSNTDPWGEKITWNDENGGADLGTYKDPETGKTLWSGGDMWGVDDGWGYLPGRTYKNAVVERHSYIALYGYLFWRNFKDVFDYLTNAYLYTSDPKYGRAGLMILDRVADVWNSFDSYYFRNEFFNTSGGSGYGAALGRINDHEIARRFSLAVDAFYPMITDDAMIRYLSEDAEERGLTNKKMGSEEIWRNLADGILIASAGMCQDGRINGNYGQAQSVAAISAIALDEQPKVDEIIEWMYKNGETQSDGTVSGGQFEPKIINDVDRDGMGNEASPRYNSMWVTSLSYFAEALLKYDGEKKYNPFENPKFVKMYEPQYNILLTGSKHPNEGDAGSPASVTLNGSPLDWYKAFANVKNEGYREKLAKYIYRMLDGNLEEIGRDIFAENPESAEKEILAYVDENEKQESIMLGGYGMAILRDGANYKSASMATAKNNHRDFWMWFGRTSASHGHADALNLGIDAFGLDVAPDLGYPEDTGYTPNRLQWVSATISHNTVVVDEKNQGDPDGIHGDPYHFDDSGKVKLMDADMKSVYPQTENYRRTVVMVQASDDVAYGVDFFRITGGSHHLFSFHSQAENAYPISGVNLTPDPVVKDEKGQDIIGTYAGPEAPYGKDPNTQDAWHYETFWPRGYTYLKNVRRDASPEAQFTVEFDVKDYRKVLQDGKGIKLRMTQFNNFTPTEVAIAGGYMPVKADSLMMPKTFDYVLVERDGGEGANLDSLFTTVYEPYRNTPYIEEIKPVDKPDITVKKGIEAADDIVRAVKVKHTEESGGNTDYIVYATNKNVVYTVTDGDISFDFSGFVGVYTINAKGAVIYRYVNDGTVIGEVTGKPSAYTGTVTGFQKENAFENYIDAEIDCADLSDLAGKYIYVDNDGIQNAAYQIISATDKVEGLKEGSVRLDLGTVTLIRGHKDKNDMDKGYIYNIKEGQTFSIPTAFVDESKPEFEPVQENISTSAGSSISVKVAATSPIQTNTPEITYIATSLPRGASLNAETGVLTWKPDNSQVGENHIAITARDSDGRENTIHFDITVYGKTTGGSSTDKTDETDKNGESQTPSAGTPVGSGGGGGGGGGAAPAPAPEDSSDDTVARADSDILQDEEKTDETAPDASGETESLRFTDLANCAWATDAINTLAADGIIKGTSETTFSPAANITRADFALLLVRAFRLTSDNAENFADVSVNDYFASELAIARNSGIVGGIGENKFAPRNSITRQDMMVIAYRAMQKLGVEFGVYNEPQHEDYAAVADYARDAVSALIGAGLVNGKSGRIAPTDYTTRAEVAVLIKRIMDYTKK